MVVESRILLTVDDEDDLLFDFEPFLQELDRRDPRRGGFREICKYFLKGHCVKGSDCPYRHVR